MGFGEDPPRHHLTSSFFCRPTALRVAGERAPLRGQSAPDLLSLKELAQANPDASGGQLEATISGYPVIQEALTRSVQRNQKLSLLVSLLQHLNDLR